MISARDGPGHSYPSHLPFRRKIGRGSFQAQEAPVTSRTVKSWKVKGETRSKKYVVLHLDLRLVRLAAFLCILFCILGGTAHVMGWLGWSRANAPVRIDGDQDETSWVEPSVFNIRDANKGTYFSLTQEWRLKAVLPRDWTSKDVLAWAQKTGFEDFIDNFRRSSVDGELLLGVTEEEIRKDLKIENNLLAKKLLQHVNKLRTQSRGMTPGSGGQALLRAEAEKDYHPPGQGNGLAVEDGTLSVYRIWESMKEPSRIIISDMAKIKSISQLHAIVAERIKQNDDKKAEKDSQHVVQDGDDKSDQGDVTSIVTREGTHVDQVSLLPKKVFVLVGTELYFFPDDEIGEKFDVFLPSDDRSVSVEVLSNTPRLLVVPNFLSPSECYEIMEEAKPLMKRSTVLRQGDQSKGEKSVEEDVRTSSTAWLMGSHRSRLVNKIRQRVQDLVKVPMINAEDMQVLHYGLKQHYHVHHDYFEPKMYPGDKRWASGHNRMITVFFYLDSVEEGGETVFPYANEDKTVLSESDRGNVKAYGPCEQVRKGAMKVPAQKGNAVIFYSMKPE